MQSFLQTKAWMEFQRSLGREVFEYNQDNIVARVVKHRLWFGRSYLYIPHGPEMDLNAMTGGIKNPVAGFLQWLKALAKKEKAIFVKAEPLVGNVAQLLAERGFKKSKKEIQPGKTVVLDLAQGEDELLSVMHHKTRYNIKVAEKHGITIKDSADVEIFWKLMQKTTKRDRFSAHPKEYYKKLLEQGHPARGDIKVDLVIAYHQDKPVAGSIILLHGDTGYYLHGASDYEYRSMMAPYKLHWENIKYLKEHGYKLYDLWGINSQRWPGVTRFKLGWGGRVVDHPGSFDWPISSLWYMGYRLARKIF